jgi:hypothetical protein
LRERSVFRGRHRRFLRERSVFFCCRTHAQVSRLPFYTSAADVFCTRRILRERSVFLWWGSHPLATLREGSVFGLIAMGLFRIARKLCIDPFAAPFAGVSPAAAIAQSLRERSVLIDVLA